MPRPCVFSGIQPTGEKHLGNYLGAVRHWVAAQDEAAAPDESLYCVVDLHAMTLPYDPTTFAERTRRTVMFLLAAGLDPERCILFVQSHVPEHTELTWILNCVATFGELRRMTQFKDKSRGPGVGERRPVRLPGADGGRHPRLRHRPRPGRRRPAPAPRARPRRRDPLQPPLRRHPRGPRGGDPTGRRPRHGPPAADGEDVDDGVSPQGTLHLFEDPKVLEKRIRSAVTDSGGEVRYDPDAKPGVSNLLDILAGHHRPQRSPRSRPSSPARGTARSRRRWPRRSSSSCARSRSATRSSSGSRRGRQDHRERRRRRRRSRHRSSTGPGTPPGSSPGGLMASKAKKQRVRYERHSAGLEFDRSCSSATRCSRSR